MAKVTQLIHVNAGWELRQNDTRAHALGQCSVLPHYIHLCVYENSLGIGAKFSENTDIFSSMKNEDNFQFTGFGGAVNKLPPKHLYLS